MSKYITIQTSNTTDDSIPLSFHASYPIPVVSNPCDYDACVIRFKVPNFETPLFTFKENYYKMYMSYNGTSVNKYVTCEERFTPPTKQVYEYQQIVQMLNATVTSLFGTLGALVTLPTANIPYFTYSETTTLFSFVSHKDYYMTDLATPIVISVNYPLFMWIAGLPCSQSPNINILVLDAKNNVSGNYVTMTQQCNTLDLISDFASIVLTSNLPCSNEYVGDFARLPILQDYTPSDLDISTFYNSIVYNAVTPYRQVRLNGNAQIYDITIDAYIVDVNGTLTRCLLPPLQTANIKLMLTEHNRNKYA
jgi:hypothetical protein